MIIPKATTFSWVGASYTILANYPTPTNFGLNTLAVNDLMILSVLAVGTGATQVTTPSGWAQVNTTHPTQTNSSVTSGIWSQFYKLATASDITSGSVTVTCSYNNDDIVAYITTFSGANLTTPLVGYNYTAGGSTGTPHIATGAVTPTGPGCVPYVVTCNGNSGDIGQGLLPAGYCMLGEYFTASNYHQSVIMLGPACANTTAINPTITWEGGSSQMAIGAMLTLINPQQSSLIDSTDLSAIAASVMGSIIETTGSITLTQSQQIILAGIAGVNSGQSTTSPAFNDPGGSHRRISATLDSNNNRTAVTLTYT